MCVSVLGEEKRKAHMGGGEKKKEITRKKEMGSGVYVYGGKKGRVEKKEEKKIEREKTKLVLFVKIYLEDVYDFFYYKWFVYISIAHTIYISQYFFLLHCSNFIKMCARRYAQIMTYFFLLIDINLNYKAILYFFITLLILYW
jgi:hypothetical protein